MDTESKTNNRVVINGKVYQCGSGSSITVNNGKVIIDGKLVDGLESSKKIEIKVIGNIQNLHTDSGDVEVKGNVNTINTVSGDIEISGNIGGDVKSVSGDIKAKTISGNCKTTSGDITGGSSKQSKGKGLISQIFDELDDLLD